MGRVVHFEIHAENPARAIEFYTGVFNWEIRRMAEGVEYWLITTGKEEAGIDGGLTQRRGPSPEESAPVFGFVNIIDVQSLDESISLVEKYGGHITVAKHAVPHIGWVAYGKDTEGNIFGMIESDKSAA